MKPPYKHHAKGSYDAVQYRAERISKGLPVRTWGHSKERFDAQVFKTGSCWFWIGQTNNKGYGLFGKPKESVHRLAWKWAFGEIPKSLWVLHNCDTPNCVNPDHLFLGRQKENMADCAEKRRAGLPAKHFLTLQGRTQSLRDWAEELGVSYQTLWWRHARG